MIPTACQSPTQSLQRLVVLLALTDDSRIFSDDFAEETGDGVEGFGEVRYLEGSVSSCQRNK